MFIFCNRSMETAVLFVDWSLCLQRLILPNTWSLSIKTVVAQFLDTFTNIVLVEVFAENFASLSHSHRSVLMKRTVLQWHCDWISLDGNCSWRQKVSTVSLWNRGQANLCCTILRRDCVSVHDSLKKCQRSTQVVHNKFFPEHL